MRSCRLFLLPLIAGLAVSLAGALTESPSSTQVTAPPPTLPLRPDDGASQALSRVLEMLSSDRACWIEAHLWQKVDVPPLTFQAEGLYLSGPEHRLRLDLRIRSEDATSHLLLVSDGQTLWQARQLAGSAASVTRMELRKVLDALGRPEAAAVRAAFYQDQFFAGLVPLLSVLKEQVTFTRLDHTRWRERDVLLLSGARSNTAAGAYPLHLPRQCRLFLDAQSLWPYRIEWWGPETKDAGDVLLSQLEFRDPVLNKPALDTQFAFQPGQLPVTDVTARWTPAPPRQE
jgi:hypothetical protein